MEEGESLLCNVIHNERLPEGQSRQSCVVLELAIPLAEQEVRHLTRAKLRRRVCKRREAREAKECKDSRVPAISLLPPRLELHEEPEPCTHTWGEPLHVSFSGGDHAVLNVCETCQGFVRRCKRCRRFHVVNRGLGSKYSMPWWVSEAWLKEHRCARRDLGKVPIPFVWTPDASYFPDFDLATYREIDGEPGRCELEWFS